MHIAFWVGLRIFLVPVLFVSAIVWAKTSTGQAYVQNILVSENMPVMSQVDDALRSLGVAFANKSYTAPVAIAKFTSGRTLSGGGFIRPGQ